MKANINSIINEAFQDVLSKLNPETNGFFGRKIHDGSPTSISDVFESDGWKALRYQPIKGYDKVIRAVKRNSGINNNCLDLEELIEDLNIYGESKGWTAEEIPNEGRVLLIGFKNKNNSSVSLNENSLRKMIRKALKEAYGDVDNSYDDEPEPEENDIFYKFVDCLSDCGWAYHDFKDGPDVEIFKCSPESGTNKLSWEDTKHALKSCLGDNVSFAKIKSQYAPEQETPAVLLKKKNI